MEGRPRSHGQIKQTGVYTLQKEFKIPQITLKNQITLFKIPPIPPLYSPTSNSNDHPSSSPLTRPDPKSTPRKPTPEEEPDIANEHFRLGCEPSHGSLPSTELSGQPSLLECICSKEAHRSLPSFAFFSLTFMHRCLQSQKVETEKQELTGNLQYKRQKYNQH